MPATDTTEFLHGTAAAARDLGDTGLAQWLDTVANDAETGTGAAIIFGMPEAVDAATEWVVGHRRPAKLVVTA